MKNKISIIISIIVVGLMLVGILLFIKNDNHEINYTEDEIRFKDEYESLNGQELAENYVLKNINIDIDNNVKYVTDKDILNLLTKGTNVIYFGWSDCNWCRSIVPTLVTTLKENNIETLYYYDFKSLRNNYENNKSEDKNNLYESILEIIGEKIDSVFDENSNRHNEKKILAPTVVFIRNGEFIGLHVKSVDSHTKSTDELNDTQLTELKNIYLSYINQMNLNVCTEGC